MGNEWVEGAWAVRPGGGAARPWSRSALGRTRCRRGTGAWSLPLSVSLASVVARCSLSPAFRATPQCSKPCNWPRACSVSLDRVSPLRPRGDGHQDRQRGLPGGVQPGARRQLGRHLVRNFPLLSRPRSPSSRGAGALSRLPDGTD